MYIYVTYNHLIYDDDDDDDDDYDEIRIRFDIWNIIINVGFFVGTCWNNVVFFSFNLD